MTEKGVEVIPVSGLPEIQAGDELALLIVGALKKEGTTLRHGDILVIGQKIVSKAEGLVVSLGDIKPSLRARKIARRTGKRAEFVEIVLQDAKRIVKAGKSALIVTTKHGWTCMNAGVDKSNIEGKESYALLPRNPDASARRLREQIMKLTSRNIGVIISDTYSRPFRRGQVEQAIGIAGISPMSDYRGTKDIYNYRLRFKNVALADELASAAELVMGQGSEMIPAAIIRGVKRAKLQEKTRSSILQVKPQEDLFKDTL